MGNYVSIADLRTDWLGINDSYDDSLLAAAIDTAEAEVNDFCGRRFTLDDTVSARWVDTLAWDTVVLPGYDIATTTGLIVASDVDGDGTAETAWTIGSHFTLLPLNGIGPGGQSGWPYTGLRARRGGSLWFPCGERTVSITAKWGWSAVPEPVKTATKILAGEVVKLKDAPFGVAGFGDLGLIRIRDNPVVARLLNRFVHPYTAAVCA